MAEPTRPIHHNKTNLVAFLFQGHNAKFTDTFPLFDKVKIWLRTHFNLVQPLRMPGCQGFSQYH